MATDNESNDRPLFESNLFPTSDTTVGSGSYTADDAARETGESVEETCWAQFQAYQDADEDFRK